ncbi:hypothetical protein IG631_23316 [Alternaria alternata]|nr:hypothetical protein IG631_23316 [Alternaria alternata]
MLSWSAGQVETLNRGARTIQKRERVDRSRQSKIAKPNQAKPTPNLDFELQHSTSRSDAVGYASSPSVQVF